MKQPKGRTEVPRKARLPPLVQLKPVHPTSHSKPKSSVKQPKGRTEVPRKARLPPLVQLKPVHPTSHSKPKSSVTQPTGQTEVARKARLCETTSQHSIFHLNPYIHTFKKNMATLHMVQSCIQGSSLEASISAHCYTMHVGYNEDKNIKFSQSPPKHSCTSTHSRCSKFMFSHPHSPTQNSKKGCQSEKSRQKTSR